MTPPTFTAWFKQSKVTDANKFPIQVYHGTANEFNTFRTNPLEAEAYYGFGQTVIGAFFSESEKIASSYPRNLALANRKVMSVYLSIQSPKKYRSLNGLTKDILEYAENQNISIASLNFKNRLKVIQQFKEHLISQGFDGITFLEGAMYAPSKDKKRVWVAFHPYQIKATNNLGTYDIHSNNIYE